MLGEADAKFPTTEAHGLPPSPSRENPGQVFPKSDPHAAPESTVPGTGTTQESGALTGNPFLLESALAKLDTAIGDVIAIIRDETAAQGSASSRQNAFLKSLENIKAEAGGVRATAGEGPRAQGAAAGSDSAQAGGLFVD
ncbi:hypothetical protein CONPUDRAFT_168462 [Coniophora puteana RWD-64-598 SS2]|uniref:Uncharacterized protein n=1 Tax=Coniophora puteana (strain RWD-64-598) TaxID=741705 RepID=A0A5M3MDD3_CONPW|nr:uncharacterized protein CONPUDRAFT_168462 [Coniophora puteana RWD-64-598 SS2]EIW76635.1 hypothetical protein CONPUDRAFT_168462 [Coniophora puteana RWD-64-598 SS2]